MEREHVADGDFEHIGETQSERQTRAVFAAFEIPDGLIVHADEICELLTTQASIGSDLLKPVIDRGFIFGGS
jgi:hypothetical protein